MAWRMAQLRSLRSLSLNVPRHFSEIKFNGTDTEVSDLIEGSLDKGYRKKAEDVPQHLLTTRREALSLYREIFRVTGLFVWKDERGRPWRDVLRGSARQEFEAARFEADPEIVNRLLVVGRDAVHRVAEQFMAKRQAVIEDEASAQEAGRPPPGTGPPDPPF